MWAISATLVFFISGLLVNMNATSIHGLHVYVQSSMVRRPAASRLGSATIGLPTNQLLLWRRVRHSDGGRCFRRRLFANGV